MKSKEELILELFFENPSKEWHFEEIIKETEMARSKTHGWLKKLIKDKLIKRIKEKNKMPYYVSNYDSPDYKMKKKLFGLTKLYKCGLLSHLASLEKTEAVILFGSFSRSDWSKNSDVDVFIYGNPEGLKIVDYELKLHRNIQVFICEEKEELVKLGEGLLRNIIKGNLLKGNLDFIGVAVNA